MGEIVACYYFFLVRSSHILKGKKIIVSNMVQPCCCPFVSMQDLSLTLSCAVNLPGFVICTEMLLLGMVSWEHCSGNSACCYQCRPF